MNILILEDCKGAALALQHLLQQQGHNVVGMYMGMKAFQPFTVIGYDKSESVLELAGIDACLCDGNMFFRLPSGKIKCIDFGMVACAVLSDAGIPCIAMSSVDSVNVQMVCAGARCSGNKIALIAALFLGATTFDEMLLQKGELAVVKAVGAKMRNNIKVRKDPNDEVLEPAQQEALEKFVNDWLSKQ